MAENASPEVVNTAPAAEAAMEGVQPTPVAVAEPALAAPATAHDSAPQPQVRSSGRARQPSQKVKEDQQAALTATRSTPASGASKSKRRPSTTTTSSDTSNPPHTSPKQSTKSPVINKVTLIRPTPAPAPAAAEVVAPESAPAGPPVPPLIQSPAGYSRARWTQAEDLRLISLIRIKPSLSWGEISGRLGTGPGGNGETRPAQGCMIRW